LGQPQSALLRKTRSINVRQYASIAGFSHALFFTPVIALAADFVDNLRTGALPLFFMFGIST